jgi:YggT family protein
VFAVLLLNVLRFVIIGLWVMVLARVLLSFVNPSGRGALSGFVISTTEPLLSPVRRLLPSTGMFDLSPLIVCIVLSALLRVVA